MRRCSSGNCGSQAVKCQASSPARNNKLRPDVMVSSLDTGNTSGNSWKQQKQLWQAIAETTLIL